MPLTDEQGRQLNAFHWHGETFGLPEGAQRLFHNSACRNQGFRYGSRCMGLQFHLEMDSAAIKRIIDACCGATRGFRTALRT